MLILTLTFIISKFFSLIFSGQFWSQNLKFFKLTEISYSGRWPCAYFHFKVYLFKILFVHILGQIWSQNLKIFKLTEICYIGMFYFLFFKIFCHSYSFRKIWSQNLKFFKMTEISYRGRWPCAYFHFNVYFFKDFFVHIFGQIWCQNLEFSRLTEMWYRDRLSYTYIGFNVSFFKIFFIHIFFGKIWSRKWTSSNFLFIHIVFWQILSQTLKFFKWTEICYIGRFYCLFFFKFFVIHIRSGKIGPKTWSSSKWLKFCTEVDGHVLISMLMLIFSKSFSFIFWFKFLPESVVHQIDWNLVQR